MPRRRRLGFSERLQVGSLVEPVTSFTARPSTDEFGPTAWIFAITDFVSTKGRGSVLGALAGSALVLGYRQGHNKLLLHVCSASVANEVR
jgi:hypothetical protein